MSLDTDDLQHLAALFHLHEKAQGHPRLKAIGDEAMKQLEQYAKSLEPEQAQPESIEATSDQGQEIEQTEEQSDQPTRRTQ